MIHFMHTGLVPKDLGRDLIKTFDSLGIQLQGKSFGKPDGTASPLSEFPKLEPEVKCEVAESEESDIDEMDVRDLDDEEEFDSKEILEDEEQEDSESERDKLVDEKFNMSYNMEGVCQFCGGHYKKLRQHMEAKHSSGLPMNFHCEKCPKKFPSRRLLNQHEMKTHK